MDEIQEIEMQIGKVRIDEQSQINQLRLIVVALEVRVAQMDDRLKNINGRLTNVETLQQMRLLK